MNYTAIFTQSPLTTIDTNAPGRWAEVDGDLSAAAVQLSAGPSGSTHTIGIEDEPQTSRSGANRWVFSQWNDGGAATHEITVPEEPSTFKADFKQQFVLTTRASRAWKGSVEVTPASDDDFHDSGSSVQLTAIPRVGFQFIAWLDENGERISHDNPMTLTMDDQGLGGGFFQRITGWSRPLRCRRQTLVSGAPPTEFSLPPVERGDPLQRWPGIHGGGPRRVGVTDRETGHSNSECRCGSLRPPRCEARTVGHQNRRGLFCDASDRRRNDRHHPAIEDAVAERNLFHHLCIV